MRPAPPWVSSGASSRSGGREAWLVDLPGTRSLDDEPAGDDPFWTYLLQAAPDAILVVVDAGNLSRHLPLALACRDLGLPVVLAVNLTDEAAKRGISVDAGRLGQLLNAPTHATCGRTGENVDAALGDAVRLAAVRRAVKAGGSSPRATIPAPVYAYALEQRLSSEGALLATEPRSLGAAAVLEPLQAGVLGGLVSPRGGASIRLASALEPARWAVAAGWATQVEHRRDVPEPLADRVARWATSPWPGIPAFLLVSVAMLLAVIYVGGFLAGALGRGLGRHRVAVPRLRDPGHRAGAGARQLPAVGARQRRAGHARRGHSLHPHVLPPALRPRGLGLPHQRRRPDGPRVRRPRAPGPGGDPASRSGRLQRPGDLRDARPAHAPGAAARLLARHPDPVLRAIGRRDRCPRALRRRPGRARGLRRSWAWRRSRRASGPTR